jgi:hypothetical protein
MQLKLVGPQVPNAGMSALALTHAVIRRCKKYEAAQDHGQASGGGLMRERLKALTPDKGWTRAPGHGIVFSCRMWDMQLHDAAWGET